jgi:multiple antibiotic resistance protein
MVSRSQSASGLEICPLQMLSVDIEMRSALEFAASAIVMLLVTIGPLETPAIFGLLTAGARRPARHRIAIQAVGIGGGVLVVCAIGGTKYRGLLHVSIPAFEVAAGILLLLQSIELLRSPEWSLHTDCERRKGGPAQRRDCRVSTRHPVNSGAGKYHRDDVVDGTGWRRSVKIAALFLALLLALGLTYLTLILVEPLRQVLGVTGTNVIARISGIVLAALAVRFILDGVGESHLFH